MENLQGKNEISRRKTLLERIREDVMRLERKRFLDDILASAKTGRSLQRLNPPYTKSIRLARRYHPLFQSKGRRLQTLNRDRKPFPRAISEVGISYAHRRQWLKNYYEYNPAAFHNALNKPKMRQRYLEKHFDLNSQSMMKKWVNSHTHTVKPGENLSRIAKQHHVPLRELKRRNQWLLDRPGGKKVSGFNLLRPRDKIVLSPRWEIPRGQTEPFPRQVLQIKRRERQQWLRDYYEANPRAAQRARQDMRKAQNALRKHFQ